MYTIEVDIDVYKALMIRRQSDATAFNDVLRDLLGLGADKIEGPEAKPKEGEMSWLVKGVSFPHGTEFKATYKGWEYNGRVENGYLVVEGEKFSSPTAAAARIAGTAANGWRFWQCRMPGQEGWALITTLRKY
jgi:hypothetical protein